MSIAQTNRHVADEERGTAVLLKEVTQIVLK